MKERDILHENGAFWVLKAGGAFHVMRQGITHSTTESAYADLSLAKARCDYLAKKEEPNNDPTHDRRPRS